MSSKSSASQASTTIYDTETHNANVTGTEGLALVEADGNTIQILDAGAIENAFNFAGDAASTVLSFSKDVITGSVERAGAVYDQSLASVSKAYDTARSDSKEDLLKIGLLLTAGLVAAAMVYKK